MIYIIRQGETDWNRCHRFNGTTETFLNQTGINQAKQQAEELKEITFDVCFCSPQKRAIQSCEIIYKGNMICDDRLAEIDCGDFEGKEETRENMLLFLQASKKGEQNTESFASFIQRTCDFCNMITKQYTNCNVLIVTHAANARVMNYFFQGKPADYDFMKPVAQNGTYLTFNNKSNG